MAQLSPNFSLEEMTRSQTATRRNIPNKPNAAQIKALTALCGSLLEQLRDLLNVPMYVSSGYRSPMLNIAIGGANTSQHCKGEAADLVPIGLSVGEAFQRLNASGLDFDQAIHEGDWLHVSFKSNGRNRGECLRATFVHGTVSYEKCRRVLDTTTR